MVTRRLVWFVLLLVSCGGSPRAAHDEHEHGHQETHAEGFERGVHQGRLLRDGAFSLELQIFEKGVPPQYRVYAYAHGRPLQPGDYTVSVELTRLGKTQEIFSFKPVGDFLTSEKEVSEPHSFDVQVTAIHGGQRHSWSFSSYEGRTVITDAVAAVSGIETERAISREIRATARIRGKVEPSDHKIAHVIPRFSGVVKEGRKHIGDAVQKGEVVAIVESNESLQPFEVRAQISGTVIDGHATVGEFVPVNQWIYVIADLTEVWVDLAVPLREKLSVKVNQPLTFSAVDGANSWNGAVSYVAPYVDERSQSQLIRAVIPNREGHFLPGMFVIGDLTVASHTAAVAVRKSAVQRFREWDVVFRKVQDVYEVAPVELGGTDGEWVEVISGLQAGDEYVSSNSYLIKADILKSGASHDH